MTPFSFSAALLAGGQSKRMGQDKALLILPGSNLPLWQRQWRVLEELQPAEIFWSGHARPGLPENIRLIPDAASAAGPLAGISACLHETKSDLLVVLAIDLPQMATAFLQSLLTRCSTGCGIVARHGDFFEPLAAVYPKKLHALATTHLTQGRFAMQDLIREAIQQGLLRDFPLDENDAALFQNLNSPADIPEPSPHRAID